MPNDGGNLEGILAVTGFSHHLDYQQFCFQRDNSDILMYPHFHGFYPTYSPHFLHTLNIPIIICWTNSFHDTVLISGKWFEVKKWNASPRCTTRWPLDPACRDETGRWPSDMWHCLRGFRRLIFKECFSETFCFASFSSYFIIFHHLHFADIFHVFSWGWCFHLISRCIFFHMAVWLSITIRGTIRREAKTLVEFEIVWHQATSCTRHGIKYGSNKCGKLACFHQQVSIEK